MTAHGHLWSLPDGTGLHAPYGQLVREDGTGRACCHLCGRWFRALGSHVRLHGYTAAGYRRTLGLSSMIPLAAPEVSARISVRQAARYRTDAETRAAFAVGQQMARTGELSRLSVASRAEADPAQRSAERRTALKRGRATLAAERERALARRLADHGSTSLPDHLRRRYAAGASLETLAAETGLGRAKLIEAMNAAGITRRPSGSTSRAGRRSRAVRADAAAAARIGTDDLVAWLVDRRTAGQTLAELAQAVGHSTPWVRSRLRPRR